MNRWMWKRCGAGSRHTDFSTSIVALIAASSAEAAQPSTIRIGLVKTLFRDVPELLIPIGLRPMKALMESQTGVNGDLIPAGDCENSRVNSRKTKSNSEYSTASSSPGAHEDYPTLKPLVIAVNGPPYLRARLVVRATAPLPPDTTLKARSWNCRAAVRNIAGCFWNVAVRG